MTPSLACEIVSGLPVESAERILESFCGDGAFVIRMIKAMIAESAVGKVWTWDAVRASGLNDMFGAPALQDAPSVGGAVSRGAAQLAFAER